MGNGWTPERRARQAELIRNWRPWERSTGPRSKVGKARAARNAFKGGTWRELRAILKEMNGLLRKHTVVLRQISPAPVKTDRVALRDSR